METNRNQLCEHCHISEWAVKHHISYFPEKIIKLCKKCHNIIHKSTSDDNLKKYDKDDSRFFYDYTRKGFGKLDDTASREIRKTEKEAKKEAKKAETKKKASRQKKYWDGIDWRKYF